MNKISYYLENVSSEEDTRQRNYSDSANSSPCDVCGNTDFIQLYRNVVGEITGSMQGYFSLFGGSISGHIDGYTKTLPVLSCRNCNNERLIKTWDYTYAKDIFWDDMHYFYFGIEDIEKDGLKKIKDIYLRNPIDTRDYMLKNKNYEYDWYNDMAHWPTSLWAKAGFDIKKMKFKKKFLFFRWEEERWPTWEEFKLNSNQPN